MSITINGNGTISGYTPVPNGSITAAKLASGAITASAMPSGTIIQYKYATMTGGDATYDSDNDSDVAGMSIAIAKTNASNLIVCQISFLPYLGGTGGLRFNLKIKRDSTEIYSAPYGIFRSGSVWKSSQALIRKVDTGANDTSSHTYKFTVKREEGSDNTFFDASATHTISAMEVAA